jgi:hypothetical protein
MLIPSLIACPTVASNSSLQSHVRPSTVAASEDDEARGEEEDDPEEAGSR